MGKHEQIIISIDASTGIITNIDIMYDNKIRRTTIDVSFGDAYIINKFTLQHSTISQVVNQTITISDDHSYNIDVAEWEKYQCM